MEGFCMNFKIQFVGAPEHLVEMADEILRTRIICSTQLVADIRTVAKAYIDEADETKRSVNDIHTNASKIQIESRSPNHIIEKAKRVVIARIGDAEIQKKVHAVAESYLLLAEKNQQLFDEFKQKYRDQLPPTQ